MAAFTSSPTPKVKMRVLAVFFAGDVLHDLVGVGLADGRLAVGEEDDGERPAASSVPHRQGVVEGRLDGGAAGGLQAIDPLLRVRRGSPCSRGTSLSRNGVDAWWRS